MRAAFQKLKAMMEGEVVICSDDELDLIAPFDAANCIRSKPNKSAVGTKDTWECWIERRDVQKLKAIKI